MLNIDNETLAQIEVSDDELDRELSAAFGDTSDAAAIDSAIEETIAEYKNDSILKGRIVGRSGNDVIVDVGLKSEGYVPVDEWEDVSEIDVGDEIEVLLEQIETETGDSEFWAAQEIIEAMKASFHRHLAHNDRTPVGGQRKKWWDEYLSEITDCNYICTLTEVNPPEE